MTSRLNVPTSLTRPSMSSFALQARPLVVLLDAVVKGADAARDLGGVGEVHGVPSRGW